MRLVGRGHPAIRATHHKTLELTPDVELTERATCVVAARLDGDRHPMAGDVRLTLRAGGESFTFEARANSSWDPSGTAVIRRSALRLPGTFATHASAAAADVPRAIVEAARTADAPVELTVEALPGRPCAVLFAVDPDAPPDARLAAELAAADVVVAEDENAAAVVGAGVSHGPVDVAGRVLVLAALDLPGASVTDELARVDVEVVGLPPLLAAAAASPSRAPLVCAGLDDDPRAVLRSAPARSRVAVAVRAELVAATLAHAAETRGSSDAVLVQPHTSPVRVDAGSAPVNAKGTVYLCFDPVGDNDALHPRVRSSIDALVADGVPTKTAAAALAALTGWDRRRAYDVVLSWPSRNRPPTA